MNRFHRTDSILITKLLTTKSTEQRHYQEFVSLMRYSEKRNCLWKTREIPVENGKYLCHSVWVFTKHIQDDLSNRNIRMKNGIDSWTRPYLLVLVVEGLGCHIADLTLRGFSKFCKIEPIPTKVNLKLTEFTKRLEKKTKLFLSLKSVCEMESSTTLSL